MTTIQKLNNEIQNNDYTITISSYTDVYLDDYENGELEQRNSWVNDNKTYLATKENIGDILLDSIEDYIENTLYAEYNEKYVRESLYDYESMTYFYYSNFVDVDNTTPNKEQIERWKESKEELFNQSISITININGADIKTDLLSELIYGKEV